MLTHKLGMTNPEAFEIDLAQRYSQCFVNSSKEDTNASKGSKFCDRFQARLILNPALNLELFSYVHDKAAYEIFLQDAWKLI